MYLIFPTHCMACPNGLMVGMKDEKKDILCVVAVVNATKAVPLKSKDLSVIGLWYRSDSITEERRLEEPTSLVLFLRRGERRPMILSRSEEAIIILYDQPSTSLITIHPLNLRSNASQDEDNLAGQSKDQALLPLPDNNTDSCIEEIINYINMIPDPEIQSSIQTTRNHLIQDFLSIFLYWLLLLPNFLFGFIASISRFLLLTMSHAIFKSKVARFLSLSVLFKQFSLRLKQIATVDKQMIPQASSYMIHDKQEPKNLKKYLHEKQRTFIIKGNLITIIVLDVILGVVIVMWLTSTNIVADMASYLLESTENGAQLLTQLIQWLMGVPAGLKLDKTLTSFLGKFFLYHIYLWQIYLKIIQPYLQTLLWTCILSGCLGMTFLISLASDVLSLLTLHIYCFYVYAARLYSLQVYTLLSLARLFTGKKWNILRSRVDSLPHDVDRLFVGTLLFTVLLFLLPTTALFYVVFTSLRLLVYVIKYLLSCATHLMNKIPLFGLLLLFFQPSLLPGGLQLEILENFSDQPQPPTDFVQPSPPLPSPVSVLYLKLTNKPLFIAQLRDWSIDAEHETDDVQDTWGTFVGKLLRGHLVYPWINRN
ncbi:phosphatidylinositol N-acetylglucosaminyltransferase subunit Q-like [Actinia tenebrosa]|uniref:Phosphatidylinositol N-acetylglucosaminyltransferase subunit Q-like n=1 Tax=Actinia tenebrosa TaxID=6105 RepID=A0A6P8HG36_ACTTE|nr:phosphatidylinositol N-acetylglucosaminyltransferase subunit Q-like [Actinia tenebrosa]